MERGPFSWHVVVIGGGATGAALTHDLTLRGIRVTLLERGELTSGTTGRHHGLLHSGARYAVTDAEAGAECIRENRVLRAIAPGSFEENGGLFVALTDDDMDYLDRFLKACAASGIPAVVRDRAAALRLEPGLNPDLRLAVEVPDAVVDPMRLVLRFFATAQRGGADLRPFTEVTGLVYGGRTVSGVLAHDYVTEHDYQLGADIVVNAAGPWSGQIGAMASVGVPVRPSPGVLLALDGRLCGKVLNRLHKPSDGDIIVPQRAESIVGTTSWVVDDPDELPVRADHVELMYREGAKLLPAVAGAPKRAAWAAARPLVAASTAGTGPGAETGRELSRTFTCFDHKASEGVEGLVTITGGKATTMRAMAEKAADVVCAKLGIDAPCRTSHTVLLPHTAYYGQLSELRAAQRGKAGRIPMTSTISQPGQREAAGETRCFRIWRSKPGWPRPRVDQFQVAVGAETTVLDVLRDIRQHHDRSLTLRFSCCHASCGTCGMRVNGREALACVTRIADLASGPVTVEPLGGAGTVHDLVVDMSGFYERIEPAGRPLIRHDSEGDAPPFARYEDCIECGLCLSACPVVATDPAYLGPAALAAAARVVAEPRGADPSQVLAWADDEQGCWRCHESFECTEACPSGVDPAGAIMGLRRELTQRHRREVIRRQRDRLARVAGRHRR